MRSFMEKNARSLAKGVSYRFCGTFVTVIVVLIFTGSLPTAGMIGVTELFGKILLYYLHERFWEHIRWGKNEKS